MFAVGTEKSPATRVRPWQNMPLTPARIPCFTVPPKLRLSVSPGIGTRQARDTDERRLLSSSSTEKSSPDLHSPLTSLPTKLRFTPRSNRKRAKKDLSDPSTRAAMSLEHVEKVITPYGFCTLAASPHVKRRESLFHKRSSSVGEGSSGSPSLWDSPKTKNTKSSQEACCTPEKPERKSLKLLLRSPWSSLKASCKKKGFRKAQKEL